MKIIKRNGEEAIFDIRKIVTAIEKANSAVPENERPDGRRSIPVIQHGR